MIKHISLIIGFLLIFISGESQNIKNNRPIGILTNSVDIIDSIQTNVNSYDYGQGYNSSDSIKTLSTDLEKMKLPPLRVFLESVYDHPSTMIYESMRDAQKAQEKMTKQEWLNYLRITGQYQYGQLSTITSSSASDIPLYYVGSGRRQHTYNIGVSLLIPIGDLFEQKQKNRIESAKLRQIEYEYEMSVEQRKLKVLEAYNEVVLQLSVLKAKADAATLYNAQMRISEQDFINGKISIIELSLERGRRSSAIVSYQEGKAALQNSITLLEMLTNVTVLERE